MHLTKRQFLKLVGSTAGLAATYHTMNTLGLLGPATAQAATLDLPDGSGYGKRVVILGAGISGMTAAYELSKAGYHCTILEATERAGGRNLTARAGDVIHEVDSRQWVDFDREDHMYANLGPARIPYHHRIILGYCKEFGVELEVFTNDNRAAFFHNTERFGGRSVVGRQVMSDQRGYIAELLAKAVNRNVLDDELTADDKERLLPMLVEYGGLDPDYLYVGSGDRIGYQGEQVHAGLGGGDVNDPPGLQRAAALGVLGVQAALQPVPGPEPDPLPARRRHGRHRQGVRGAGAAAHPLRQRRRGHPQDSQRRPRRVPKPARLSRSLGFRLRHLHHPRACFEGHPQRLLPRDAGGDRVHGVRAGGQDRLPSPPPLLGRGSRHLRRHLLDRSGHHANLVPPEWISPRQRRDHGRLHLGGPARPGRALGEHGPAGAPADRHRRGRAHPPGLRAGDRVRDQPRLAQGALPKGRLAGKL